MTFYFREYIVESLCVNISALIFILGGAFMYFVGIDISKYKHDCFITTETDTVITQNLSFQNNKEAFNEFLNLLKSLDNSQEIRIGFEATGHYHLNLMLFLEENGFSFMEFNPALVKSSFQPLL